MYKSIGYRSSSMTSLLFRHVQPAKISLAVTVLAKASFSHLIHPLGATCNGDIAQTKSIFFLWHESFDTVYMCAVMDGKIKFFRKRRPTKHRMANDKHCIILPYVIRRYIPCAFVLLFNWFAYKLILNYRRIAQGMKFTFMGPGSSWPILRRRYHTQYNYTCTSVRTLSSPLWYLGSELLDSRIGYRLVEWYFQYTRIAG